jgi:hypothetical protein
MNPASFWRLATERPMNRALWTYVLAVVMVVVAAASAYLVKGKSGSENKEAAPPEAAKPEPLRQAVKPAPEAGNPVPPVVAAKPVDVKPTDVAKPAEGQKKLAEERDRLLATVASLTEAHCFQTYLNIGLIADGKAKGTYSDKDARRVLDSVLSVLNSTDRKLEALDKIDLTKDDREKLEQLRAASALLRQQGKELQGYWDTGKEEQAAKYETLRKNAWATISTLMGIGQ